MRPKWDNLFWFQRGDDNGKAQLENNTTKSFLKILKEVNESVAERFVNAITCGEQEIEKMDFETQVSLDFVNKLNIPLTLVGLSYWGNQPDKGTGTESDSGLVDGLVIIQNSKGEKHGVVLEVKTGTDSLKSPQMAKYREKLNPVEESYFSWPDTYKILEEKYKNTENEKDAFLLKEFLEYLELMDMVPFKGFDQEQLKNNYRQYIKDSGQLQATYSGTKGSFARAIQEELNSRPDSPLSDFEIVSDQINKTLHFLKKEHFDSERSFPAFNHFTVGFWRDRLNLHLNARNRIKSRINETGKAHPNEKFAETILNVFPEIDDSVLMSERNPIIYNRLERKITGEINLGYPSGMLYTEIKKDHQADYRKIYRELRPEEFEKLQQDKKEKKKKIQRERKERQKRKEKEVKKARKEWRKVEV